MRESKSLVLPLHHRVEKYIKDDPPQKVGKLSKITPSDVMLLVRIAIDKGNRKTKRPFSPDWVGRALDDIVLGSATSRE